MLVIFVLVMGTSIFASFYTEPQRKFVLDATPVPVIYYDLGAANPYLIPVLKASRDTGLEPELIASIILVESCEVYASDGITCTWVNPYRPGLAGEKGLMQIMPSTYGNNSDVLWIPEVNIDFGSRYLKEMIVLKGSVVLGVSAYNTGPGGYVNQRYIDKTFTHYNALRKQRKLVFFRI